MISCKEAARKWDVSERRVQQYCASGQVDGAVRMSGVWLIPDEAEKPGAPAAAEDKVSDKHLFILLNTDSSREDHLLTEDELELKKGHRIYTEGRAAEAITVLEPLMDRTSDVRVKGAAALVCAVSAFYVADFALWSKAEGLLASLEPTDRMSLKEIEMLRYECAAFVYDFKKCPEWLAEGRFEGLPVETLGYAAAFYCVRRVALSGEDGRLDIEPMVSYAEAMGHTVPSVYLHLIASIVCMNGGDRDRRVWHIERALDIAESERCYSVLAEMRKNVGTALDEAMKRRGNGLFQRVEKLNDELIASWNRMFALYYRRDNPAQGLTVKEAEIANYIAIGKSNKEIAAMMNYSENTVRSYISVIFQKLNIHDRSRLAVVFSRAHRAEAKTE